MPIPRRICRPVVTAGLMLAACGSPEPAAEGNRAAEMVPAPATEAPPPAAFPARMRGRWGLVPADCEPGRADAKGLMEIAAGRATFYESRAIVTAAAPGPGTALTLAFTGEGQEWTVESVFRLSGDGRILSRTDRDPPLSLRYMRCPA